MVKALLSSDGSRDIILLVTPPPQKLKVDIRTLREERHNTRLSFVVLTLLKAWWSPGSASASTPKVLQVLDRAPRKPAMYTSRMPAIKVDKK
ncbi:hypothetical protein AVEN_113270-1 [Araneus ventricosus]|uniref:Uncharacterized protein n=1 Tax=Araneus ventricosus TaxID=182803 RepID=A0A4Y2NXG2_ARAVE|nr:hypothetical protein AVEN_113270-1 [Araneus ventricosus]